MTPDPDAAASSSTAATSATGGQHQQQQPKEASYHIKLRCQYAEGEVDYLLFRKCGDEIELLETPYTSRWVDVGCDHASPLPVVGIAAVCHMYTPSHLRCLRLSLALLRPPTSAACRRPPSLLSPCTAPCPPSCLDSYRSCSRGRPWAAPSWARNYSAQLHDHSRHSTRVRDPGLTTSSDRYSDTRARSNASTTPMNGSFWFPVRPRLFDLAVIS